MIQRQLLAKRIGIVAITNLLVEFNSLIMLPLLTKNLPISEYGIWAQITVTLGLVPAIALLGLPYSMVRFLPSAKGKENIQEIFYSMAAIIAALGLVAFVIIFFLSEPISWALFGGRTRIVQILSLLVLVECLNSIPFAYFRSVQQIKKYSIFNFTKVFFNLLLVVYLVLSGWGIFGAVFGYLISSGIMFFIMGSFVVTDLGIRLPKFNNMKDYLSFGTPTIPGNLSNWIVNSSDRYVISLLMGINYVGYYSPGYTIGNEINIFITPFSFMLPATLSKHYDENDVEEVRGILSLSLKYFLMLGVPSAFGLSVLSHSILNVLTTPEIANQGYLITPFIAISILFLGAMAVLVQIIVLEKKTAITGTIWIVAAILKLGLNFFLIPYLGIVGAAITTLIAFAFAFAVTMYYTNKTLKVHFDLKFLFKSLLAAMTMSVVLLGLNPVGLVHLVESIVIGASIYFLVLIILKGITVSEIYSCKKTLFR